MKIAWIGTGVMGKPMLMHLKNAGYDVYAYNRTYQKMLDLLPLNVKICKTIEEAVVDADVVFTMLGYPKDVEEVYLGISGIFANAKKFPICIDMTTSSPTLARKIANSIINFKVLDAPVTGGDVGAQNATLSIMVGGDFEAYEKVLPLLQLLGKKITYVGKSGYGQHYKLVNQILVSGATASMTELMYYCESNLLDLNYVLDLMQNSQASSWQLQNSAKKVLDNNFEPGFFIKHFVKDLKLIDSETKNLIYLKMVNQVLTMYEYLNDNGYGDKGTQALIQFYKETQDKGFGE